MSALSHWKGAAEGRSFEEGDEDDVSLTAQLRWREDDQRAGGDLDTMCDKFGIDYGVSE
jgi:hypothetical protein